MVLRSTIKCPHSRKINVKRLGGLFLGIIAGWSLLRDQFQLIRKVTTQSRTNPRPGALFTSQPDKSSEHTIDPEIVSLSRSAILEEDVSRNETLPLIVNNFTQSPARDFNLWDESTVLPEWMKEYFAWHQAQRKNLRLDNWNQTKYLVMTCRAHHKCGGTSDRLKPAPLILWYAYQHQRIFLILWERPAKLEEFLLPPEGGIDWRVPDWLNPKIGSEPCAGSRDAIEKMLETNSVTVRTKYQTGNGGQPSYDELVPGKSFKEVYHEVWRTLFTPVPAIAEIVLDTQKRYGLSPGNYAAAHLRSNYALRGKRDEAQLRDWVTNSVFCASELRPGGPIYFASDSRLAMEVVHDHARTYNRSIVSLIRNREPLHLAYPDVENKTLLKASDFYDTFVDLYMLGMSRCLAYNVGGFGSWGLMLSYNSSCEKKHTTARNLIRCNWTDPPPGKAPPALLLDDHSIRKPMMPIDL